MDGCVKRDVGLDAIALIMLARTMALRSGSPWDPGCVPRDAPTPLHRSRCVRTAPASPGRARGAVHALGMDSMMVPVATTCRGTGPAGVDRERLADFNFPGGLTFGVELEMALGSNIARKQVAATLKKAGLRGWK